MCCSLCLLVCSLWLPYVQPWEEETHFACCSLAFGMFSTNNNKHNLCARLIRTFFMVLTGRVWRRVPAKRLLTPDRQWMWGHLQGGAVLSLRFLSTCIIRYAVFFGPSLYLFHGSHWAWDRKAYGSVSACFLNLAICPLVPITLLPDLNSWTDNTYPYGGILLAVLLTGESEAQAGSDRWVTMIDISTCPGNSTAPEGGARGSARTI